MIVLSFSAQRGHWRKSQEDPSELSPPNRSGGLTNRATDVERALCKRIRHGPRILQPGISASPWAPVGPSGRSPRPQLEPQMTSLEKCEIS